MIQIKLNYIRRGILPFRNALRILSSIPVQQQQQSNSLTQHWLNQAFSEDLLHSREEREFLPSKDPSFIIDSPEKYLSAPYLGQEYLLKAKETIASSFSSSSSSSQVFFIVKGFGSGKTRFLEELKFDYYKNPQVIPITISFVDHSIYTRENEFYYPNQPFASFTLAVISRIAASFYRIQHNEILQRMQQFRERIDEEYVNANPQRLAELLRNFFTHILQQQNSLMEPSTINQFVLLVDEVMQMQNNFPSLDDTPITIPLQLAFTSSQERKEKGDEENHQIPIKTALVIASDHPLAVVPLIKKPSNFKIPFTSLAIPGNFETKDILNLWFLAPNEQYYPNILNQAKKLSNLNLLKIEYNLIFFKNFPRGIQILQDHFEDRVFKTVEANFRRDYAFWDDLYLKPFHKNPAEYKYRMKISPTNQNHLSQTELVYHMMQDDHYLKLFVDDDVAKLWRNRILDNSLIEEEFHVGNDGITANGEPQPEQFTLSILFKPSLYQLILGINDMMIDDSSQQDGLLDMFAQFFQMTCFSPISHATNDQYLDVTFRGKLLATMGTEWLRLKCIAYSARINKRIASYMAVQRKEWTPLTPEEIDFTYQNARSLATILHLHSPISISSYSSWITPSSSSSSSSSSPPPRSQIDPKILSLLEKIKVFVPNLDWIGFLDFKFTQTSTQVGKRQFLKGLNSIEIASPLDRTVQALTPTLPTENDAFDILYIFYNHENPQLPFLLFCNFQSPSDQQLYHRKDHLTHYHQIEKLAEDSYFQAQATSDVAKAFVFKKNFLYLTTSLIQGPSYSDGRAIVLNRQDTELFFGFAFPFYQMARRVNITSLYY